MEEQKTNKKRIMIVAGIAVIIIALAATAIIFLSGNGVQKAIFTQKKADLFSGFSKLIISGANAEDNFEFIPVKKDSLGVEPSSEYILKSKESVDTNLIKENLIIEPEMIYQIQAVSDKEWKITPENPVEPNTVVKISLASSYIDEQGYQQERDYSWAYQIKDTFKVVHSIPRDAGQSVPVNTGIEITFSHDNFIDYEKYFEINPAVEGFFEKHGRTLVFVPKNPLKYGSLYSVTLKKGLPLSDSSETLKEDYLITFETSEINNDNKYFNIYKKSIEINSKDMPIVELYTRNITSGKVDVGIYKFNDASAYLESIKTRDKLPWWSYSKEKYKYDTSSLDKVSSFTEKIKKEGYTQYIDFPFTLKKGFYLAELNMEGFVNQLWIQVTDLSIYMNVTKTNTIIWTNDTIKKAPAENAQIKLLDSVYNYTTNSDGVANFATPNELLDQAFDLTQSKRYYFEISKDDNILIIPASQIYRTYWWEAPQDTDDYWQYFYTDRPRYQSTDTIKYWGMLKGRDEKNIDEKITVTLFKEGYVDYYYQPVKIIEKDITLSDINAFEGEIKLENMRPDYYTLEIKVGEKMIKMKYINIEPYIKPAYQINLVPDRHVAFAGETVNLKARASFFEGTPVPDLKLVYETPLGTQNVVTNDKGEVYLTYKKDYFECNNNYGCWPDYSSLSIKPEDSELAEINADAYLRFYGPKVYLNTKEEYPEAGKAEIKMTAKFYDLKAEEDGYGENKEDRLAPGTKIEGQVRKIKYLQIETGTRYDYINKKSYKTYRYERQEEDAGNFSGITDQNGVYVYKRDIEPETSYEIKIKAYDSDGRYDTYSQYLYYYNGKYFKRYSDYNYSYYHFEFPDAEDDNTSGYAVGEEVAVSFMDNDEPMPDGQGKYLYLQLQNGLQEYTASDNHEYKFKFEKRDIPNVNLVGVYFDGSKYITTQTSYYGRSASYNYKLQDLTIKITPDKELYKPGENINLSVDVVDINNHPIQAEVNLNLIDEAYYAVASDYSNPLDTIYANVRTGSLFTEVTHTAMSKEADSAEMGGCFAGETLVLMANGSEKRIEAIKKGDRIKTFSDPISRKTTEAEVTEVWRNTIFEYLIINKNIRVSQEHQIFSNNRFIDAGLLKVGDWLLDYNGNKKKIDSIEIKHDALVVYNLRIDPEHTFFAGGIYVHNQEKGGGPREYFTDAALFQSLRTDSEGKASISFKLPDNITSWRVTAQGISKDLYAGISITKIPVSLPVFAEVSIGNEYLLVEKPIARLRSYGTALSAGDEVTFSVDTSSMGVTEPNILNASAFQPVYYNLPAFTIGKHSIIYKLNTAKGDDAIKLPIRVIESRLEAQVAKNEKLKTDTKIVAENNLPLAVVLSDEGQNQLYDDLLDLNWSWGDRVDQSISRKEARRILNEVYNEDLVKANFNAFDYQLQSGGISLLPYSSEELELSARVASVGADYFDKESLAQYFYKKLEDNKANREEISLALFGLASLQKPVLPRIQSWLERGDLSVKEKLYIAQALFDLGASEWSRGIYNEILKANGEEKTPYIMIHVSDNLDDVFGTTALAAVLATSLNAPQAEGLWKYVTENQILYGEHKNSENLFNLEKINYIKHALPNLKPSPAKVTYELYGKKNEIEITGGRVYSIQLQPENVDELKFITIEGDVGISTRYTRPINTAQAAKDDSIQIKREYYVKGKRTSSFSEKDIIEVRLYPSFGNNAIIGNYQITDFLPSGLAPVTKLYRGYGYDCNYWYPYNTDGQKVKYSIHKNWRTSYCGGDYIKYYARVKNRGEFKAEPATIQSFINPSYINFSNEETITTTQ